MSDDRYVLYKHPIPGRVVVRHPEYRMQLWIEDRCRKRCVCVVCNRQLKIGSFAYRPITDLCNRTHRICTKCVDSALRKEEG